MPAWFPDLIRDEKFLTEQEMMAAIEKNKEAEQKKAQTAKKSVSEEETKKTEKPTSGDKSNVTTKVTTGCYFGNCNEGFGG